MTIGIQVMREKICELGRSLYDRKLTDNACNIVEHIDSAVSILLKTRSFSAFAPEAPGLPAWTALLKEDIDRYGNSNE